MVDFKTAMLMGLYNAELRKNCLIFMPKEIKHESEIRAVLDDQLTNLTNERSDEMLKTRQVPMDVNAMLGNARRRYMFFL